VDLEEVKPKTQMIKRADDILGATKSLTNSAGCSPEPKEKEKEPEPEHDCKICSIKLAFLKRSIEPKLKVLPMFSNLNKSVRDFIISSAQIEVYKTGERIPRNAKSGITDSTVDIDLIYVISG